MIYICISKGKGFSAWMIRWFTSFILRRDALNAHGVKPLRVLGYIFLTTFGLTKYAKIRANYNHTFLMYESLDFKQWYAIDITDRGVVPVPVALAFDRCKEIRVAYADADLQKGIRATSTHIGREYDWLALVGAVWAIFYYVVVGKSPKHMLHAAGRDTCTEFVTTVINNTPHLSNIGDPAAMYPELLYKTLSTGSLFTMLNAEQSKKVVSRVRNDVLLRG